MWCLYVVVWLLTCRASETGMDVFPLQPMYSGRQAAATGQRDDLVSGEIVLFTYMCETGRREGASGFEFTQ